MCLVGIYKYIQGSQSYSTECTCNNTSLMDTDVEKLPGEHWELLWPGTSPGPGKNRSGQLDQAQLTHLVGGWVANLFASVGLSRVMGGTSVSSFIPSFALSLGY